MKFFINRSADSIIIRAVGSNPVGNIPVLRRRAFDDCIEMTRPRIVDEEADQERTESTSLIMRREKAQTQTEFESQKPVM